MYILNQKNKKRKKNGCHQFNELLIKHIEQMPMKETQ